LWSMRSRRVMNFVQSRGLMLVFILELFANLEFAK
jgi:hypothetical protein